PAGRPRPAPVQIHRVATLRSIAPGFPTVNWVLTICCHFVPAAPFGTCCEFTDPGPADFLSRPVLLHQVVAPPTRSSLADPRPRSRLTVLRNFHRFLNNIGVVQALDSAIAAGFAAWLASLPDRRRRPAELHGLGHGTDEVARALGITAAVSQ